MKNNIDDLRNHLFETIERLKDSEEPMELERAKTIAGVAQTIINSAKVEVDLLKHTGTEPATPLFIKPKELPGAARPKNETPPARSIEHKTHA
jgi:hypothetical protein